MLPLVDVPDALIGTAGTYHVMAVLAARGFHASCTFGNAPFVDILVSSAKGDKSVAIQVKTTREARRWRGKGEKAIVKELQWALGYRAAKHTRPGLFFAFVNMKGSPLGGKPDVYLVPGTWLAEFCAPWVDKVSLVRFHVAPDRVEPFRDNWDQLEAALA